MPNFMGKVYGLNYVYKPKEEDKDNYTWTVEQYKVDNPASLANTLYPDVYNESGLLITNNSAKRDSFVKGAEEYNQKLEDGKAKGLSLYEAINGANEAGTKVDNDTYEETTSGTGDVIGGILLKPITGLLTLIVDGIFNTVQHVLVSEKLDILSSTKAFPVNSGGIQKNSDKDPNDDRPYIMYSPEEIFSGKIAAFNINFIQEPSSDMPEKAPVVQLRGIIASWYNAIRMLCMVILLTVLVYMAIRMIISSSAQEKSKYKSMIMDWVVAMCLLFFLHYIMSFTLTLTESFTKMVNTAGNTTIITDNNIEQQEQSINVNVTKNPDKSFSTNMIGYARYMASGTIKASEQLTWMIIYFVLVFYTLRFTFVYLKRVLMMAFLTIIAPFVALTYPIDKVSDGKAQAFDMWLKEYIFNALLQPFHLIIYTIFVSSALELCVDNPVYAIVAIGFIIPAEGLLRKMFGFGKAQLGTMSALSGFAGGAIANNLFNKAKALGNGNKGKDGGKSGGSQKIRQKEDADLPKSDSSETSGTAARLAASGSGAGQETTQGGNSYEMLAGETQPQYEAQTGNLQYQGEAESLSGEQTNQGNEPNGEADGNNIRQIEPPSEDDDQGEADNSTSESWKDKAGRIGRAYTSAAGQSIEKWGKRTFTKENGKRLLKGAARGYFKAGIGIGGAALGLAYGTTTGDFSKAASYAALGGAAGVGVGGAVANKAMGLGSATYQFNERAQEQLKGRKATYEKRKREQMEKAKEAFMSSTENDDKYNEWAAKYYSDDVSLEQVKEDIWEFKAAKVNDEKIIEKAIKLKSKTPDMSNAEAVSRAQAAQDVSLADLRKKDTVQAIKRDYMVQLQADYEKATNGSHLSDAQLQQEADRYVNDMRAIRGLSKLG